MLAEEQLVPSARQRSISLGSTKLTHTIRHRSQSVSTEEHSDIIGPLDKPLNKHMQNIYFRMVIKDALKRLGIKVEPNELFPQSITCSILDIISKFRRYVLVKSGISAENIDEIFAVSERPNYKLLFTGKDIADCIEQELNVIGFVKKAYEVLSEKDDKVKLGVLTKVLNHKSTEKFDLKELSIAEQRKILSLFVTYTSGVCKTHLGFHQTFDENPCSSTANNIPHFNNLGSEGSTSPKLYSNSAGKLGKRLTQLQGIQRTLFGFSVRNKSDYQIIINEVDDLQSYTLNKEHLSKDDMDNMCEKAIKIYRLCDAYIANHTTSKWTPKENERIRIIKKLQSEMHTITKQLTESHYALNSDSHVAFSTVNAVLNGANDNHKIVCDKFAIEGTFEKVLKWNRLFGTSSKWDDISICVLWLKNECIDLPDDKVVTVRDINGIYNVLKKLKSRCEQFEKIQTKNIPDEKEHHMVDKLLQQANFMLHNLDTYRENIVMNARSSDDTQYNIYAIKMLKKVLFSNENSFNQSNSSDIETIAEEKSKRETTTPKKRCVTTITWLESYCKENMKDDKMYSFVYFLWQIITNADESHKSKVCTALNRMKSAKVPFLGNKFGDYYNAFFGYKNRAGYKNQIRWIIGDSGTEELGEFLKSFKDSLDMESSKN